MPSPIYERRAREAKHLINCGMSKSRAAETVGIGKNALNSYLKGNLKPKSEMPPTLHETQEINSLGKQEAAKILREFRYSYQRIAQIIGVSHSAVYRWRDMGVFDKIETTYKKQR